MSIKEFNSKFMSNQEKSRLFDALRRVSRLEVRALLSSGEAGWAEWPPSEDDPEGSGTFRLARA